MPRMVRIALAPIFTVLLMLTVAPGAPAAAEGDEAAAGGRLVFNVTSAPFGAKADGTSNDTKAIQAAIDACDPELGGTVYFPRGRYVVDTVVLTRPHLTLRGDGAILVKSAEVADHVFKDMAGVSSGLSCYGLTFDLSRPSFELGKGVSAFF